MNRKPNLTLLAAAAALTIVDSASAATVLLTDNFNSDSFSSDVFNSTLAADQGGTVATVSYTLAGVTQGWDLQHGNGGEMILVGADGSNNYIGDKYASLNRDFAVDANTYDQALKIDIDLRIINASDPTNWASFGIGNVQNAFVTNKKFSSLFRFNGGTQQFSNGSLLDQTATWTPTGSTLSFVLSDTGGAGSAFNGDGSVAKLYIDNVLQDTWTLAQLGEGDGFFTFEANGTFARYDNLAISVIPEPTSAALGLLGLGGLVMRRRRA